MKKFLSSVVLTGLLFNALHADLNFSYNDLTFILRNGISFTKNNQTREDLDHGNFKGTAATSSWISDREYKTYTLNPRVLWKVPCTNYFAQVSGYYGWTLDGRSVGYPLRWDVDGHVYGAGVKTGYVQKVSDRFDFIPYIGYRYDASRTSIHHQHFVKSSSTSFISQNGNKAHRYLNIPYIGFELAFNSTFWDCYKVQFITSYELGYGWGRGTTKVPEFIVTSEPNTSRYGSTVKYRDMMSHEFAIAAAYSFAKHWTVGLEFDYNTVYNTHNLPVKLQHNAKIVKAGQYKKSQYHVVSDDVTQNFSIVLGLAYSFGEASDWITR